MNIILFTLGLFFALLGILGSILPIVPGPLTAWIGLLLVYLIEAISMDYLFLSITFIIALVVFVLDQFIPIWCVKKFGGDKESIAGSIIGLVVGFLFLGPFGLLIGTFLGAFIGGFWSNFDVKKSIKLALGALIGFLWYNTYPAQVFMGDTGSLTIGGIIAVIAIAIRKELLLPILAGIFVVENLSVMLQVSYFKYTKKKFGEGRRIFKMSPLHHHYQKLGYHESKIVVRFWIVGILLAVFAIVTLKLR